MPFLRWCLIWLKNHADLQRIKTKSIATERVDTHFEKNYKDYFKEFLMTLREHESQVIIK